MFLTSNCGKLWFLCNSSKNLPGKLDRNKCIVFAFIKAHRRKRQAYADNREHTVFEISDIFTIRKRSCGKEMFSQACVKNSVHGVGGCIPQADTPNPLADTSWQTTPPRDGHCGGRYASYWNAFLWNCFWSLSLLKVSIKLDSLITHLEEMSLSLSLSLQCKLTFCRGNNF